MKTPMQPQAQLLAVTFDLDGLMFNTEELYQEVGRQVLERRGKQLTGELLDEMMGRKSNLALQIMIDWHELDATAEALGLESMEIMSRLLPERLAPCPGLLELLDALQEAGIPRGIATSSGRAFVEAVLAQSELRECFSFVLSSENIEHGKPAPDVYLLAAEKHAVQPAEMLVLEDSQIGCRAANAAGAYTVAVPSGRSHDHDFEGVRFIADTLTDERIYQVLGL